MTDKTCENCKFKVLEPLDEEAVKRGEGFKQRRSQCRFNPPLPIAVVSMIPTPEGPRPIQQVLSVYPMVFEDTPACSHHERTLTQPAKKLEIVK